MITEEFLKLSSKGLNNLILDFALFIKINSTKKNWGRIIAIVTTVLRSLESTSDENGFIDSFNGETSIFISPGNKIKSSDFLVKISSISNFSSLNVSNALAVGLYATSRQNN